MTARSELAEMIASAHPVGFIGFHSAGLELTVSNGWRDGFGARKRTPRDLREIRLIAAGGPGALGAWTAINNAVERVRVACCCRANPRDTSLRV